MSEQKVVYTDKEINDFVDKLTERLIIEHAVGNADNCKDIAKQINIIRQLQTAAGAKPVRAKKPRTKRPKQINTGD